MLMSDPKFVGLDMPSQKAVLAGVDPRFSNLSDADFQTFRTAINRPAPVYHPGFLESAWNTLKAMPGGILNTVMHPIDSTEIGQYTNSMNSITPAEWAKANADARARSNGGRGDGKVQGDLKAGLRGTPPTDTEWPTAAEYAGRLAGQGIGDAAMAGIGYGLGEVPWGDIGTGIRAGAPSVARGTGKIGAGVGLGWLESKLPLPPPVLTGLELTGAPLMYQGGKQIISGLGEGLDAYRDARYGPVLGPELKPKGFKAPSTAKGKAPVVPPAPDPWTPTATPREAPVKYPANPHEGLPSPPPPLLPDVARGPVPPPTDPWSPSQTPRMTPVQYAAGANYDPLAGQVPPVVVPPVPKPVTGIYQAPFEPVVTPRQPAVKYAAAENYDPNAGVVPEPVPVGKPVKVTKTKPALQPAMQPVTAGGAAPFASDLESKVISPIQPQAAGDAQTGNPILQDLYSQQLKDAGVGEQHHEGVKTGGVTLGQNNVAKYEGLVNFAKEIDPVTKQPNHPVGTPITEAQFNALAEKLNATGRINPSTGRPFALTKAGSNFRQGGLGKSAADTVKFFNQEYLK